MYEAVSPTGERPGPGSGFAAAPGAVDDGLLAEAVHQLGDGMMLVDTDGVVVYANAAAALLGWEPAELIGRLSFDFVHPDDLERAATSLGAVSADDRPLPGLVRLLTGDGAYREFEVLPGKVAVPGVGDLVTFNVRDSRVSEAHWAALAAMVSKSAVAQALEVLAVGLSSEVDGPMAVTVDDDDGQRRVLGALPEILGTGGPVAGPDDPFHQALADGAVRIAHVAEMAPTVAAAARAAGLERAVLVPVPDPGADRRALIVQWPPSETMAEVLATALPRRPFQLVSLALQRRADQRRLEHLALHDALTGLANRTQLFAALERLSAVGDAAALCYVDLDGFKQVNDRFGHLRGDQVLVEVADGLTSSARVGDLVARLGGDEFAVLCPRVHAAGAAGSLAGRIVDEVHLPIADDLVVTASVGVALVPPGTDPDAAVHLADGALYDAKRAGRSTWRFAAAP